MKKTLEKVLPIKIDCHIFAPALMGKDDLRERRGPIQGPETSSVTYCDDEVLLPFFLRGMERQAR